MALIITRMKVDFAQLNICITKFGQSPAELNGTGDPAGTPAPVKTALNILKIRQYQPSPHLFNRVNSSFLLIELTHV